MGMLGKDTGYTPLIGDMLVEIHSHLHRLGVIKVPTELGKVSRTRVFIHTSIIKLLMLHLSVHLT